MRTLAIVGALGLAMMAAPGAQAAGCLSGAAGSTSVGFDVRLRVEWTDDPGPSSSVVTFAVSP